MAQPRFRRADGTVRRLGGLPAGPVLRRRSRGRGSREDHTRAAGRIRFRPQIEERRKHRLRFHDARARSTAESGLQLHFGSVARQRGVRQDAVRRAEIDSNHITCGHESNFYSGKLPEETHDWALRSRFKTYRVAGAGPTQREGAPVRSKTGASPKRLQPRPPLPQFDPCDRSPPRPALSPEAGARGRILQMS